MNTLKRSFTLTLLATTVACLQNASALSAGADTLDKLDQALSAAGSFQYGRDAAPLLDVEQIVFHLAPDSPLRKQVEDKLLAALDAAKTADAKRFLCRQLRVIGTDRSVPHLERLLVDPELAHVARYALGRLEGDAASKALLRALAKTSGKMQVGIINTLANRHFEPARADLIRLLASTDADVAHSAARGLGRLGGTESVAALRRARTNAANPLVREIDNALLEAAGQFVTAGKLAEAASIYEFFYESADSQALQFAGLRGLICARPDEAARQIVKAVRQDDANLRRFAISLTSLVPATEATQAFAGILSSLPAEDKVLMLAALGERSDKAASEAIVGMTQDAEEPVRVAAVEALGQAGNVAAISVLLERAAEATDHEQAVARASLSRLQGADVNGRLMQLARSGDSPVRVEAVRALAARGATEATPVLLQNAKTDDATVRREAVAALGTLARQQDLAAMIQLASRPQQPDDRSVLETALGKTLLRLEDKHSSARLVLQAVETASAGSRPLLLRLLSKSGSADALPTLRAALRNPDSATQDAAVQALADWPDLTVIDDLRELVATSTNVERRQRALSGYVRLAAQSDEPTELFVRILDRVSQTGGKKTVLEQLGLSCDSPAALELALKYLDDKPIQPTAGLAALRIAHKLRGANEPLARASLQKVIDVVQHPDVHKRALEVLNDIDKYADHILDWVGVGPFTVKGEDGPGVYRTAFDPEVPEAAGSVKWKPITRGLGRWDVNLEATFGGLDYCAAYLRTRVSSDADQSAQLELGSDDAVKVWLNGELIFDKWVERGASPRQDRVPIQLKKGWNVLMLKVVDQQGGWVAGCRIRRPDGTHLDGLKIQAE